MTTKVNKKVKTFTDSDFVVRTQEPGDNVEPTIAETAVTESTPVKVSVSFKIEEIAIPKRTGRGKTLSYPIADLTPGSLQSFLVPATADTMKKVQASIRTFAYRNGFKVTLRPEDGCVRVWRASEAPAS